RPALHSFPTRRSSDLLLMPVLQRAVLPRVTTVSSGAGNMGTKKINFDDLQWERSYGPWKAYCQSKLADLMFTLELGRRCAAAGRSEEHTSELQSRSDL